MENDRALLNYFSNTYDEAREKFLRAANGLCDVCSYYIDGQHVIDVATTRSSPQNESVYIDISGVHGVEGYFGSAVQCAALEKLSRTCLPKNITCVFVHGVNAWGMKNFRRTTRENVDLNRNFLRDRSAGLPPNTGYDELRHLITPQDRAQLSLNYIKLLGRYLAAPQKVKDALSKGQYTQPDGLFYGGASASQEEKILKFIIAPYAGKRITMVDWHTGGGRQDAELIFTHPLSDARLGWWKSSGHRISINTTTKNNSSAVKIDGALCHLVEGMSDNVTTITHEIKTLSPMKVFGVLLAVNGFDFVQTTNENTTLFSKIGLKIPANESEAQAMMRHAFYPDSPDWRLRAIRSGLKTFGMAIAEFSQT